MDSDGGHRGGSLCSDTHVGFPASSQYPRVSPRRSDKGVVNLGFAHRVSVIRGSDLFSWVVLARGMSARVVKGLGFEEVV